MAVSGLVCNLNLAELEAQDRYDALLQGTFLIVMMTGSLGALRAPTSSWMPFKPLESQVAHLCRLTGRIELEGQLSVTVSQYRRLLSSCIVRAQAQCLISRVGVISPQAREAAKQREVSGRVERELREERTAQ